MPNKHIIHGLTNTAAIPLEHPVYDARMSRGGTGWCSCAPRCDESAGVLVPDAQGEQRTQVLNNINQLLFNYPNEELLFIINQFVKSSLTETISLTLKVR